jgi:hypothetical protein
MVKILQNLRLKKELLKLPGKIPQIEDEVFPSTFKNIKLIVKEF